MAEREQELTVLANDLIDGFIERGHGLQHRFAVPFPSAVFLRLMGLPLDSLDECLAAGDERCRLGQSDSVQPRHGAWIFE